MKYYIKTGNGVSQKILHINKEEKCTWGQVKVGENHGHQVYGSRLCRIILTCLQEKSKGMSLRDPTSSMLLTRQTATGFIDNISTNACNFDLAINGTHPTQDLVEEVTTTTQWWEQLLAFHGRKTRTKKMRNIPHPMEPQQRRQSHICSTRRIHKNHKSQNKPANATTTRQLQPLH